MKLRASRQLVVAMVVATALCADRAASAAPGALASARPQVAQIAGRLVSRLSVSFRRVMPGVRLHEGRTVGATRPRSTELPTRIESDAPPPTLSPFHFRLPPPTTL